MKYPTEVLIVCDNYLVKEKPIGFNKRDEEQHVIRTYIFDLNKIIAMRETVINVNDIFEKAIWVELEDQEDICFLGNYDEFVGLWKTTCNIPEFINFKKQ